MITVRKSNERGHLDHGWLDTRHTFSFGHYHDPRQMGYRTLRVINDDVVAPGQGFGEHSHRDMEIITYVLSGELAHKDSTGGAETLRPGEVQRMSAGRGVRHSEFNASRTEPVHLLQIWIVPERGGIEPGYEQKAFPEAERRGRLRPIATPDGAEGSLRIHQDARAYASLLDAGQSVRHDIGPGRGIWIQVARGGLAVNGRDLSAGDGAAIEDAPAAEIVAASGSEFILFDLA